MEVSHYFGSDILTSVNGDLQSVDVLTLSNQRILRRLLTNPGAYIWHLDYGAGLPAYIGQTLSNSKIQEIIGIIRNQIFLETSVSQIPAPIITITPITDGIYCSIQYTEATTQTLQLLTFNVSN
jgi:hypothetical protein